MPEIWISADGLPAELTLVDFAPLADGDDGWFPEGPGERPPRAYEMRVGPNVVWERVVFPVAPWSPYDAVADILVAEGWAPPPSDDDAECEHGMSARLCSGPRHY